MCQIQMNKLMRRNMVQSSILTLSHFRYHCGAHMASLFAIIEDFRHNVSKCLQRVFLVLSEPENVRC